MVEGKKKKKRALFQVRINTLAVVCTHTLPSVTLVRGALASGYLEVSGDVVSACGSGFILFGLTGTCINFSDSFTVGEKSFCGLFCFFKQVGEMFPLLEMIHAFITGYNNSIPASDYALKYKMQ